MASDTWYGVPGKWRDILNKWTIEELKCLRCSVKYHEVDNIGQWKCAQHPGLYIPQPDARGQWIRRWTCCGGTKQDGPLRPSGCVRADHTILAGPYTEINDHHLPSGMNKQIALFEDSLINPFDSREWQVERDHEDIRRVYHQAANPEGGSRRGEIRIRRFDWRKTDSIVAIGGARSHIRLEDILDAAPCYTF